MGKDKKRSSPVEETEAAFEPHAVVLESIPLLEHKKVVYHQEFNPTCLVLTKPIPGKIEKPGEAPIKYTRRRLLYKHDEGYCDFLLAQEDDSEKDTDVLPVPFGFNESSMNGQMTYSGGVSLPWPSTLSESSYNSKKNRLIDYINTDPATRNITDTILMVYKRICWLFFNSVQAEPKLAEKFETERDVMKELKCPVEPSTYKDDSDGHKTGQFNFKYTPRMYVKLDVYADKKVPGKMNVSSKFYDLKDEEIDIMTHLQQPTKIAPVVIFKGVFTGAKSSVQSSLFEANKVTFSAKFGGRERVLRPKIKTADDVASTSQFDRNEEEEVPVRHKDRKDRKKRQEADEEY